MPSRCDDKFHLHTLVSKGIHRVRPKRWHLASLALVFGVLVALLLVLIRAWSEWRCAFGLFENAQNGNKTEWEVEDNRSSLNLMENNNPCDCLTRKISFWFSIETWLSIWMACTQCHNPWAPISAFHYMKQKRQRFLLTNLQSPTQHIVSSGPVWILVNGPHHSAVQPHTRW